MARDAKAEMEYRRQRFRQATLRLAKGEEALELYQDTKLSPGNLAGRVMRAIAIAVLRPLVAMDRASVQRTETECKAAEQAAYGTRQQGL